MIPFSTQPVPFTPPWLVGQAGAPVFFIRPGTLVERAQLEAELAGPIMRAGRVYPWDMANVAADAARALLDGEQLAQVLDAVNALRSAAGLAGLPLDQRQLLVGIDAALAEAWPEYAELRQREARRNELLPLLACQRFLVGWQVGKGLETPFIADKEGRPSEASLRLLGSYYLPAIGMEAYRLLYAEDQRPLSPPPSKSGQGPKTSPAAAARRSAAKAGKSSTARAGKK